MDFVVVFLGVQVVGLWIAQWYTWRVIGAHRESLEYLAKYIAEEGRSS